MAETTQKDAEKRPLPGSPEARESGRRNLNSQIAQRQKMLLAGIGAIALIGGGMFIFGGDGDEGGSDANGAATIDTGGLVNRNLSQREFVASYGNRLDAQGRAIKDLQQAQLPRPEIEQELEALRSENAQMRSDGQAAIDAISAENANLRSQLSESAKAPAAAPPLPPPPAYGPGVGSSGAVQPPQGAPEAQGGQLSLMSFSAEPGKDGKPRAAETAPALLLEASRDYLPPNSYAPATVMRSARFHFTGRDLPDPIDEVDLMPFGVPEFAGAYEHMRRDLQS